MKLIGAALILAAAVLASLSLLREKKRRLDGYRSIAAALGQLRGELSSRGVPLSDGIKSAENSSKDFGRALMGCISDRLYELGEQSFSEIWNAALTECCGVLEDDDLEELKRLGAVLGRFDLDLQLQALDACISFLEDRFEAGRSEYPAQRRLLLSVTLALSSFMVILFY